MHVARRRGAFLVTERRARDLRGPLHALLREKRDVRGDLRGVRARPGWRRPLRAGGVRDGDAQPHWRANRFRSFHLRGERRSAGFVLHT